MNKYLKIIIAASAAMIAGPSVAGTQKMPSCLIYSNIENGSVPCTGVVPVDSATGNPLNWQDLLSGSGSSSGGGASSSSSAPATSTTLNASATTGTTKVGPFVPQLNRALRIVLRGTWAGTVAFSTSVDGCVTISPLTIAGAPWASFTANANEDIDVPHVDGVVYCATATLSSGTVSILFNQ